MFVGVTKDGEDRCIVALVDCVVTPFTSRHTASVNAEQLAQFDAREKKCALLMAGARKCDQIIHETNTLPSCDSKQTKCSVKLRDRKGQNIIESRGTVFEFDFPLMPM